VYSSILFYLWTLDETEPNRCILSSWMNERYSKARGLRDGRRAMGAGRELKERL